MGDEAHIVAVPGNLIDKPASSENGMRLSLTPK